MKDKTDIYYRLNLNTYLSNFFRNFEFKGPTNHDN